jgi:hypothetical protein
MPYPPIYYRTFKLGQLYINGYEHIVKFIKVTPKGYNLLDIKTNKCIIKGHLYSRNFSNVQIPEKITILHNVAVPNWHWFKEISLVEEDLK